MMQKRTVEIAVGLFVLFSIISLMLLAIKVSGLSDLYESRDGYTLSANFENVGGLKPRARVTIAGVQVGRVIGIKFDQEAYLARVTMIINRNINNLPNDSKASILTAGLLGDNYIGLLPGFSDEVFEQGSHILVENTESAVILEELISKFVAGQASGL